AVLVKMVLGAEEGVVTERFGQLAAVHHLGVELRHGARELGVMVVDREEGITHRGIAHTITISKTHFICENASESIRSRPACGWRARSASSAARRPSRTSPPPPGCRRPKRTALSGA